MKTHVNSVFVARKTTPSNDWRQKHFMNESTEAELIERVDCCLWRKCDLRPVRRLAKRKLIRIIPIVSQEVVEWVPITASASIEWHHEIDVELSNRLGEIANNRFMIAGIHFDWIGQKHPTSHSGTPNWPTNRFDKISLEAIVRQMAERYACRNWRAHVSSSDLGMCIATIDRWINCRNFIIFANRIRAFPRAPDTRLSIRFNYESIFITSSTRRHLS